MDAALAQFQSITGLENVNEARMWLEMAGGDVGMAVGLMFGGGGGGGGFGAAAQPAADNNRPDWFGLVWPDTKGKQPVLESWLGQGLVFSEVEGARFGLVQRKNGPCGVLAAVQAVLCSQLMRANTPGFGPDFRPTPQHVAVTLSSIISQCREDEAAPCVLAGWKDDNDVGGEVTTTECAQQDLPQLIMNKANCFAQPGGVVLLVYSCLLTRTPAAVRRDIAGSGGEAPLVVGPNWLCSPELVALFLKGRAQGNVLAYNPLAGAGGDKVPWAQHGRGFGVGMLSQSYESQAGMPLADDLKSPAMPVWVLHGGDHFTVAFATQKPSEEKGATIDLWLWNGLPPAGPRMCQVSLTAKRGSAGPAKDKHESVYYKPLPGEIDGVVQARKEDKNKDPHGWKDWHYEVVLAFDDPTIEGKVRPADKPGPPIYEQGPDNADDAWRCTRCYSTRFKTMCFGLNDKGARVCRHCDQPKDQCGWSIWMTYSDLPNGWQRTLDARHAPKVVSLLRSKWPGCEVRWDGGEDGDKAPMV